MVEKQQFEVWKEELMVVLQSKVDELQLLNFPKATVEDVWDCTLYKLRKKKNYTPLHAFVNTILTLKPAEYMNWLTVENYQTASWFDNKSVLEDLVKEVK